MSLEVRQQKIVALAIPEDKVQLLKNTVCKNATNDELSLFLHVCERTGLDPFRNQIYAIKRKEKMTIQTGIDGFRLIAERTGKYSPGKEPSFSYDEKGKVRSSTCYIKKQTQDGTWHEVSATAYWEEYVQEYNGKPSNFWAKMPHTMLAKVAESICLRKAFPADFSGIYTTEEMAQADNEIQIDKNIISMTKVEEERPDFTEEEVQDYLDKNWPDQKDEFRRFMSETALKKCWSLRKCADTFDKHVEYTKKTFESWKCAESKNS